MKEVKEVLFINESNAYLLKTKQLKERLQWACDESRKHERGTESFGHYNGYASAIYDIVYSSVFDKKKLLIKDFDNEHLTINP
jgi:hypothetical protein